MDNKITKSCSGWCLPTVIYLILSIISVVSSLFIDIGVFKEFGIILFFGHLIITSLFIYLMYWLCSNCNEKWAWFILLFPIITFLFIAIFAFGETYIMSK